MNANNATLSLSLSSPPLEWECIFGISRLYFTCIPPVSHPIYLWYLPLPLYRCTYNRIDLYHIGYNK